MSWPDADTGDHSAGVVAVELTIDGALLIADRMGLTAFPTALAIRPNIADERLRDLVWGEVQRDLSGQGVLNGQGEPHPAVATMVDTICRAERMLEGRWWRRADGGSMVRFALCRSGKRHVLAVRFDEVLLLQVPAPGRGLAEMLLDVLGPATPADVEPITAVSAELASCSTEPQLTGLGVNPDTARIYADIIENPAGWVEIIAGQGQTTGTAAQTTVAVGVLDSVRGRLVSEPRRVGGQLYTSVLPGTPENLQRALDGLLQFLPAGDWSQHAEAV